MKLWLLIAAANGIVAVAAGAYGHHALDLQDDLFRTAFLTGVTYQMWHGLALLAVAWLVDRGPAGRSQAVLAGTFFTAGIVLFSGSLYWLGFFGSLFMPHAAPFGGILFMLGWAALGWSALKQAPKT